MLRQETQTLSQLGLSASADRNTRVTGVTADSRAVKAGNLFAALPGTKQHGAEFIRDALDRGATAILTDDHGAELAQGHLLDQDIALAITNNPRRALAETAARWFNKQPSTIFAITGTNGKTSVANFVRQIWMKLGYCAINFGTIGVEGAWEKPLSHTTPEPTVLHAILAEAKMRGVTHVAMEASSHGLQQHRLDAVKLQAAAFTNFSQDHLDYHASLQDYFESKMRLFRHILPAEASVVVNVDDPRAADVCAIADARGQNCVTVGRTTASLRLLRQSFDPTGQSLYFTFQQQQYYIRLDLIGGFQAQNALLAAALVIAGGASAERVFNFLASLVTVRGRMQLVATRLNGAQVFIDFAHTPDALTKAIEALRPHVIGRLIAIIGAGGDRDKTKRPLMGRAASNHADLVYVTDDNPRSENAATIRSEVLSGAPEAIEVGDRAEAIVRAIAQLMPGDALLIAGKGHESVQIVGDAVFPFDDAEHASMAVEALEGISP
ncbi:MAG: UDP-N-acetylmuramoyl-L-alanyl-D-glutamate--2,6-diaminopimelate ligase [Aestuariivita sp.]|nr:UDP-N-acetylmuramoyl-L-alanyl-D-glutamate--2,6-diaminopimelate ligase [Aestuariivita sp.]MCY4345566.1 UDP-N-acetylmuramoyl-L-alanyl-D-glutamate--2,6-diaminopimelate ligase [Aestuariivita sp.]